MTVRITKSEFNLREKISELDKPTGRKGLDLMRSETSQDARDFISAGRKNKLFNGDMKINQRGSSFTSVGSSANTFTLDRWKFYIQNSTARFTVSKDSDSPDEFGGSMKIECTTTDTSLASTDEVYLEQRLEGQDVQDFAKGTRSAKEYTLSFYVKTNKVGTYIVNLLGRDNTTSTVSASYTVNDTNWNRYTVTFPADASSSRKDNNDNGEALRVLWWFVAGSAVNSPSTAPLATTWRNSTDTGRAAGQINFADSTSNEFFLTGCQLEVGRNVTEFEHRSYGEELRLCQRYYTKSYNHDVAPGTNTMVGTRWGRNYDPTDSRSANVVAVFFPVTMRATPDMTFRGVHTGDTGKWTTGSNNPDASNTDMSVNSLYDLSDKGFSTMSSANISASNFFGGHYEANAEF